jgi:hypothetical protein
MQREKKIGNKRDPRMNGSVQCCPAFSPDATISPLTWQKEQGEKIRNFKRGDESSKPFFSDKDTNTKWGSWKMKPAS